MNALTRLPGPGTGAEAPPATPLRTLFVAPQVPWPPDVGSRIRTWQLLRSYALNGPVTLLCLAQQEGELAHVAGLAPFCEHVHCLAPGTAVRAPLRGMLGALRRLVDPLPALLRAFESPAVTAAVARLLENGGFDVLHVERLCMARSVLAAAPARGAPPSPWRVLDVDDLESAKTLRAASLEASWRRRLLARLEASRLALHERRLLARFDSALVCSARDRGLLERSGPEVVVFSNGADLEEACGGLPPPEAARTLLFLGAMDYRPNDDAALHLVRDILPAVRARAPDVRLRICGKHPSAALRALTGPGVEVPGFVADRHAALRGCAVFVVPLRMGGGTRIKILEAMAAGVPVVSTRVGCEGIDAVPGEHLLVADTPTAFADACAGLLADPQWRARLGAAGRDLVRRSYRWDAIRGSYAATLGTRLRQRRRDACAGGPGG